MIKILFKMFLKRWSFFQRKILNSLKIFLFIFFLLTVLISIGFLFFTNHVKKMRSSEDLSKADGIIVLTGGKTRLDEAVRLLKKGKAERLLITGVHPKINTYSLLKSIGANKELFNCCIDIDYLAINTAGNAKQSSLWIKKNNYKRIILVTNNYHMPRSLIEMNRLIKKRNVKIEGYPVFIFTSHSSNWLSFLDRSFFLLIEYAKYLKALFYSLSDSFFFSHFWEPSLE